MIHSIEFIIFLVGIVTTTIGLTHLVTKAIEKINNVRTRKQAHEKRHMELLESINQKLSAKP